jgi:methylmalonyl-CoA mutase
MLPPRKAESILSEASLSLGEPADESRWRTLVEQGLKGAQWQRLVGKTADGVPIEPLYRETDISAATDISGFPEAAPFVRGARAGAWAIRQAFEHPGPQQTNAEILADLSGGVGGIELVIDPDGKTGAAIRNAGDMHVALADVILEAAPVSLDAAGLDAAALLEAKLKGVAATGTAFNVDPLGTLMRTGASPENAIAEAAAFAHRLRLQMPSATSLRVDARPVHEAGGTEAQEIGAALSCGIAYLRALADAGMPIGDAGAALSFAIATGADVLIETAKLRALRLCWARVMEASGAPPVARAAHIHAFTSRRMMTRYDAWTNILRVATAAFAAGIGGADAITTRPFTDALGLPTPFARRIARNTQNVLLEECRLGHVADPAGGAWFVEKITRDFAGAGWSVMQSIEANGGIVAALQSGRLHALIAEARTARERAVATRRETITGVTDFPLLDAPAPDFIARPAPLARPAANALNPIRWAAPFERLRDRAEAKSPRPTVFFATLGRLAQFGPRAQFARNLLATGGVAAIGEETEYGSTDAMIDALRDSGARVAVICGDEAAYAEHGENAAQRLKAAGAAWVALAGKPGESEAKLRGAGVDQFIFAGQDALKELETLHQVLGVSA